MMTQPLPWVPERPRDVWRVCGQPITPGPGSGCTCTPNDPTKWAARRALTRLSEQGAR